MFSVFNKKSDDPKIYSPYFSEIRKSEYFRLDNLDQVYLDYFGSNLYPQTLVDNHYNMLSEGVYGHPKVLSPSSEKSRELIEETRAMVLSSFDAEDYYCIFTDNSISMSSFRDNYPFGPDCVLLSSIDGASPMKSVIERCLSRGGTVDYIKLHSDDLTIDNESFYEKLEKYSDVNTKLLAYPAQSSISGTKHGLNYVTRAQDLGWDVLLEADIYAATNHLSLKKIQPAFVSISFYKIFGYPTGIGCLLVRKDKSQYFEKIDVAEDDDNKRITSKPKYQKRLRDGTINFLDIPMIKDGLEFINKIGADRIQIRMEKLVNWMSAKLTAIQHDNGSPVVEIYGTKNLALRGNCLLLNLYDNVHEMFPLEYLNQKCQKRGISVRSGYLFENIGSDKDVSRTEYLSDCFTCAESDPRRGLVMGHNKISTALRLSIGIPTVQKDLDRFVEMVEALKNKNYQEIKSKQM